MSIKSSFKKGLYTSLIVAAGLLLNGEVKGQDFVRPVGIVNMFQSLDNTVNAQAYNKLKTKEQRDSIIDVRVKEDWVNTIARRTAPTSWDCNEYARQVTANSHDWGKDTYYEDRLMYNGYEGSELEQIYQNYGTLKDIGKLGLPTHSISLYDGTTLPQGHAMNAILTGDDATKFEDWTIIEPQTDAINVKPGQHNTFPKNCKQATIYYTYTFKNTKHEKNYYKWEMLEFEIIDGIAKITYDITKDTTPVQVYGNKPLNEVVKLITQRKDINTGIFNKPTLEQITKIYPNPANNYINIEIPGQQKNINAKIYSIEGKLEYEKTIEENEQINIETLTDGMYFIKATNNNYTYTGRFVKQ